MTDLLQLVPYLLGFHPTDSVVAILLHRRRVLLTARVDLGPVVGLADQLARITRRHRATGMVLAAYTGSPVAALAALETLSGDRRLPRIVDAVHVEGERWWSLQHPGDPAGERLDRGQLAAEAVFAGLSAAADRSHAVAGAAAPPAERLAELIGPLARAVRLVSSWDPSERRREALRLVTAWWPDPQPGSDSPVSESGRRDTEVLAAEDLVRLGVLTGDVEIRDELIMQLDLDGAEAMVRCWSGVVSVLPDDRAAAPLCLLGLSAWLAGHGALLVGCVERVERTSPDYTLGRLLAQIADQAIPPSAWSSLSRAGVVGSTGVPATDVLGPGGD